MKAAKEKKLEELEKKKERARQWRESKKEKTRKSKTVSMRFAFHVQFDEFFLKICLNCRKKGHSVSECREAANIENGGVLAGCCFNCGSNSHGLRDCPKPIVNGQNFELFGLFFI